MLMLWLERVDKEKARNGQYAQWFHARWRTNEQLRCGCDGLYIQNFRWVRCQKGCCLRCTRVVAVDLISWKQKNLLRLFDVNIWRTEFEKSSKFEINILSAAEINRVTNQIPTKNSQITSHHSRHVLCEDMSLLSPLFHVSCPAGALQETSPYRNGSVPSPGVQQASAGGLVATWCELKQGMYITEVHVHRGTCTSVPSANPRLAGIFASELRENHQRELGSSLVRQYSRVEVSTEKNPLFLAFCDTHLRVNGIPPGFRQLLVPVTIDWLHYDFTLSPCRLHPSLGFNPSACSFQKPSPQKSSDAQMIGPKNVGLSRSSWRATQDHLRH